MTFIQLALALFVEGGSSDSEFLATVVQRTAQQIINQYGRGDIEVPERLSVVSRAQYKGISSEEPEQFLEAAREFIHYHVLIFHKDADSFDRNNSLQRNFAPARDLVLQHKAKNEAVCDNLVPVIPVRTIEAWVLADSQSFYELLNTKIALTELDLPETPKQIESNTNPKHTLEEILRKAKASIGRTRGKRVITKYELFQQLGREVRLEELDKVPAYKEFKHDLIAALQQTNLIQ